MIELFQVYTNDGKDLYIPILIKQIHVGMKIFVYKYKSFVKKWVLSSVLYDTEDEFNKYTTKYKGSIDYHKLFKCVFIYENKTEYGDII